MQAFFTNYWMKLSYFKQVLKWHKKAYFNNFYEQISETLIGESVAKVNDCLCNLVFDIKKVST